MAYLDVSVEYLAKADEAIEQRDMLQASEKLWGGAAQMVKAVAERRGWRHDSHASLYQAVTRLVEESDDAELHTLFLVAGQLHTNFYEHWLTPEAVIHGRQQVHAFVDKLGELLNARG